MVGENNIPKIYFKYWYLFWYLSYTMLYAIIYFTMNLFTDSFYLLIFLPAIVISIYSRFVWCKFHDFVFRFNVNLIYWTIIYVLILFFAKTILDLLGVHLFPQILLIGLFYLILIKLLKKLQFIVIKAICIFFCVTFAILFVYNNLYLDNNYSNVDSNSIFNQIKTDTKIINYCDDGSIYGACSRNKPFFCDLNGILIKDINSCGCPSGEIQQNNECISIYNINPKTIKLGYTLRGKKDEIEFVAYKGLNDYYANKSRVVTYTYTPPSDEYMVLRFIADEKQLPYIQVLVNKIKTITTNSDDQARIAINLVQSMPYDWDSLKYGGDNRYAYETLYDQTGVCADKSSLLAVLLKQLGYGVVIFDFRLESHEAVGIKCPLEYSYLNTGYCFIESTTPSIITDSYGDYIGVGKLISKPNIYLVSDGKSFNSVKEEYDDAKELTYLESLGQFLSSSNYNKWENITDKYGFIFDSDN